MAFVPGLSKSQVVKVIENYADLAPATMQLIDDLSAQINDPNDPAAALISRMTVVESDLNAVESSVSSLSSSVSGKQDAVAGISSTEIGYLDGVTSSIQTQIDSKAPLSNPTLSNPTLTGTITLPNASIANSKLANSSISINGTSVSLGGNVTVTGTPLPSQADNAGKALVTDGSSLSWQEVDVSNLTNPTITTGNQTTAYEITGLNYLGSYGTPGDQYFRPDTDPAGMTTIQNLNITGPFSVVISGSNSVFDGTWEGNSIASWAVTFYGPTPDGNFPSVPNTENFTFSIVQGSLNVISPTELSYLDGLTGNVEHRLSNLTNPTISINLGGTADVKTSGFGSYNGPTGTSYTIYPGDPGYDNSLAMATYFGAVNFGGAVNASINTTGITSGGWISGATTPNIEIYGGNINIVWASTPFDGNATFSSPTFTYGSSSTISPTEISKLDGLTTNIQTKFNSLDNDIKFDSVSVVNSSLNYMAQADLKLSEGGVKYYTQNYTYMGVSTFGVNLSYGNSEGLNSNMEIGKAATFVLMNKNGASNPGYPGSITIDDSMNSTTIYWQGGSAPTSGNANSVDIYTFTVVKTANNTFSIFADVAKFA